MPDPAGVAVGSPSEPWQGDGVVKPDRTGDFVMSIQGVRRAVSLAMAFITLSLAAPSPSRAADCPVSHEQLANALKASVKASGGPSNGGFDTHQWASVVTRAGT